MLLWPAVCSCGSLRVRGYQMARPLLLKLAETKSIAPPARLSLQQQVSLFSHLSALFGHPSMTVSSPTACNPTGLAAAPLQLSHSQSLAQLPQHCSHPLSTTTRPESHPADTSHPAGTSHPADNSHPAGDRRCPKSSAQS